MTDEAADLMLEHLRVIRNGMNTMRDEIRDDLSLVKKGNGARACGFDR
jgi:hypothetical protein